MTNVVSIQMPTLNEHAAEIKKLGKRVVDDIIEIGRRLSECRAILKQDGKWRAWLKTEFGWSRRSAERFISLYDMSKSDHGARVRHSDLPLRTLYLLANPSTPASVRKEILSSPKTSHKDVVARLRHSKGGNAAALTAERRTAIEKAIIGGSTKRDIAEKFQCSGKTVIKLRKQLIAQGKFLVPNAEAKPPQAPMPKTEKRSLNAELEAAKSWTKDKTRHERVAMAYEFVKAILGEYRGDFLELLNLQGKKADAEGRSIPFNLLTQTKGKKK